MSNNTENHETCTHETVEPDTAVETAPETTATMETEPETTTTVEPAPETELDTTATPEPDTTLTVFEESLTKESLEKISREAALLPQWAKTELEYDQAYEFSTRLKRLSTACRKREKAIQKELRKNYNEQKQKIKKDLEFVLGIIEPLITKSVESREYIECWKLAIKQDKARTLAAEQERERIRIEIWKAWDEAHEMNDKFDRDRLEAIRQEQERIAEQERQAKQAEELKAAEEKLKRERYEFECTKSRLNFDEAWKCAYPEPVTVESDASSETKPATTNDDHEKILPALEPDDYPASTSEEPVVAYKVVKSAPIAELTLDIKLSKPDQGPVLDLEPEPVYKQDKFIVINRKNLKYLNESDSKILGNILSTMAINYESRTGQPYSAQYYVCNQDEPYAPEVIKTILEGEKQKLMNSNN
jgi:hypothetical protein